jgi:hypothetical protein
MASSAVVGIIFAALFSGAMAMQRCFAAVEDYAIAKADQTRLTDYIAMDLRRALTVTAGTGGTIMTVTIPDYYDSTGAPRTPTITKYVADYGNATAPVTVAYKKFGSAIVREEGGTSRVIATGIEDFQLAVEDLDKVVKTKVSFRPQFRRRGAEAGREGTLVHNTTFLRNRRK